MKQREIKFRAWDKKDMVYFELNDLEQNETLGAEKTVDLDDCEIMQYTGLKDKNGVEIFEGDILENDDYIEDAHCCNNLGKTIVEFKDGCFVGIIGEIIEVIGNIYSNTELLK